MSLIENYKQLLEGITSNKDSLDEIFSVLETIKQTDINAYVEGINEVSAKIQQISLIESHPSQKQFWYNPDTKQNIDVSNSTHLKFAQDNPKALDIQNDQYGDGITKALNKGWVRVGAFMDHAYVTANKLLDARKALNFILNAYPALVYADVEVGNTYNEFRGQDMLDFIKQGKVKKSPKKESLYNTLSNKEVVTESVSCATALKARNDIIRLARRLTDSSNVTAPSNFESYEDKDDMILKVSVFDFDRNKLQDIKDRMAETLRNQGWKNKDDLFIKNNVKVKFYDIKKSFRSGAYQNRETPHFGIAVKGPKKPII